MKIIVVQMRCLCCFILYLEGIDKCCIVMRIDVDVKERLLALLSVKNVWHVVVL